MLSTYTILNKEKEHLLGMFCSHLSIDKTIEETLIQNLKLSVQSVYQSYEAICQSRKKGTSPSCNISTIDQSWVDTFSRIYELKVNEIKTKMDLNKLVAIFKICVIQVSHVLKGYCDRQDGSLSKRIPLYPHLRVLEDPILKFVDKFVTKAIELSSQNSNNFLDMLSDLSSIYLEHKVLLLRLNSPTDSGAIVKQLESLFQNAFPDSIEPRLDTFLKCESLNNLVASFVCPLLRQILDQCARLQNKYDTITFGTYVKFILVYARLYKLSKQAKLDSELVLEQARYLQCSLSQRAERKLESLLQMKKRDSVVKLTPARKINEMYIISVRSVTKTYENLRSLPLNDRLERIPTESIISP
uniref:Uncharacterized protein n=1 Tax=Cacopsylla melanoneura TaxID=428564 RepID=A0A8D8YJB7_9HEMI